MAWTASNLRNCGNVYWTHSERKNQWFDWKELSLHFPPHFRRQQSIFILLGVYSILQPRHVTLTKPFCRWCCSQSGVEMRFNCYSELFKLVLWFRLPFPDRTSKFARDIINRSFSPSFVNPMHKSCQRDREWASRAGLSGGTWRSVTHQSHIRVLSTMSH